MRFVWDEKKSRRNRAKHKVSFETAASVFDDPRAISRREQAEGEEERWQTLGLAGGIVVLLVVHIYYEEDGEETYHLRAESDATGEESV